ncbi:Crp/Fnr family transcriptional regulator [Empedobacter brevis]|uniref:Crp/Fnr family transcriptional regulator n=1 Tax=Empedobacter brevis TaxID=247 RepID=UPI00131FA5A8|nr:Crp/Fnr family transcriptional regulator [Empedobacter brevis]QHC85390.1 Crp/Fnr family transcriptional regulator [Empedobacter brevis]
MSEILKEQFQKIIRISDEEFDYILGHFSYKKFRKHQFLVQDGQDVMFDYFLLSGCVKSYYSDENGKIHILLFAVKDWWITDYEGYYDQKKAIVNIDCIENTEVLCLSNDNREKLCREFHQIEHFFRKKTNRRNVALQNRILSLLSSNAKERYEKFIQEYPSLVQKLPKHILASYLGVTRETLSRLYSPK